MNLLIFLLHRSTDSFIEFLLFLPPEDCCQLSLTCKALTSSMLEEKIWWHFCRYRIPGLQLDKTVTGDQDLEIMRQLFHFPSYRQFYTSLYRLQVFPFGWFHLIPFSPQMCHGGLYHILVQDGEIRCLFADDRGQYITDNRSLRISYSSERRRLVAESWIHKECFLVSINNDTISFILQPKSHQLPLAAPNNAVALQPLPPLVGLQIRQHWSEFETLAMSLGLFTARYGSHGSEILHLSLHSRGDVRGLRSGNNFDFGDIQLQGLKITGDPNVPSNQLSFCINIQSLLDINAAFNQDNRPIIIFPPDRQNPIVISLQQRLPMVQLWARGYGQINRDPNVWAPEWVRCAFILYKQPLCGEAHRAMFSILWDDEHDYFRHAMDFRPLPYDLDPQLSSPLRSS
jgi:hypothetical protein